MYIHPLDFLLPSFQSCVWSFVISPIHMVLDCLFHSGVGAYLGSGFHQSPLLSSFFLACGICPAPACGAYLRVFTNALFLIAFRQVSVDGFPAWFDMFLLFCLMNLINFWLWPLRPKHQCLADWRALRPGHTQAAASKKMMSLTVAPTIYREPLPINSMDFAPSWECHVGGYIASMAPT